MIVRKESAFHLWFVQGHLWSLIECLRVQQECYLIPLLIDSIVLFLVQLSGSQMLHLVLGSVVRWSLVHTSGVGPLSELGLNHCYSFSVLGTFVSFHLGFKLVYSPFLYLFYKYFIFNLFNFIFNLIIFYIQFIYIWSILMCLKLLNIILMLIRFM